MSVSRLDPSSDRRHRCLRRIAVDISTWCFLAGVCRWMWKPRKSKPSSMDTTRVFSGASRSPIVAEHRGYLDLATAVGMFAGAEHHHHEVIGVSHKAVRRSSAVAVPPSGRSRRCGRVPFGLEMVIQDRSGRYWPAAATGCRPGESRSRCPDWRRRSVSTPACRNALTRPDMRLSAMRSRNPPIRAVWSISSKHARCRLRIPTRNPRWAIMRIVLDRVLGAAPRPEPVTRPEKSASKIGSNTSFSDACTTRSATVGIPSLRTLPLGFGDLDSPHRHRDETCRCFSCVPQLGPETRPHRRRERSIAAHGALVDPRTVVAPVFSRTRSQPQRGNPDPPRG